MIALWATLKQDHSPQVSSQGAVRETLSQVYLMVLLIISNYYKLSKINPVACLTSSESWNDRNGKRFLLL
jgi:hypothetical protein